MFSLLNDKWSDIKEYIKEEYEISNVSYDTWIAPLRLSSVDGDTVFIELPEDEVGGNFISYIDKKYNLYFKVAIEEKTGFHCEVRFITSADKQKAETEENEEYDDDFPSQASIAANLNPRYTFSTFVVGANNKFAHAASLAVAESPAERYNPLFIYGGVGLGKTHLMHSIAHFILKNNPEAKVLYTTSENFTNELIDAIRTKNNYTITQFREKYRKIDVLLIDDIQFIINKESTQEEFFHTFNYLHENNKQIVISSDKPPKAFTTLEERLRSRFEMGLPVDISSPDYETRMAILRKKEELEGYNIDNEILKYIATNIKSNIRELEGALTKIIAFSKLYNTQLTMEAAEEALKDLISPNAQKEVTPALIIEVVAEHFGFTTEDLISTKRNREVVYPRQIAMYLCRTMTPTPLQAIGTALGKKDHTTIMHGIQIIEKELKTDETLASTIEILKKKINPG
ncbi:MAG: chromosomal replication initiator protein DnaA [Lachnospiraceae bacterium]|nr:chromosomal replication initiator protein DnaA [Cuneatibacter sp.]MDD6455483.1 chromosomal replication initiator protein DnaA [Lachnospiraceae bacterium]